MTGNAPGGPAGEKDDSLQFAVEEKIIERPDAAFFSVGV